jgi:hypothetical protein
MRGFLAALLVAVGGCVASGYGGGSYYDGGGEVGYGGVDVYEGPAYDYGGWGWGRGYRVGPPRGGFDGDHPHPGGPPGVRGGGPPQRAYHPAPPSRSMPSIPSGPRGGGGHSGGGGHRP